MQFLLFGALQHGSTLYNLSSLLTRRAAIALDDSPEAWGGVDHALLVPVERSKTLNHTWINSKWETTVLFRMYMDALAEHGAEVEFDPQLTPDSKEYTLVPTAKSELTKVSERLTVLHNFATRRYVLSPGSTPVPVYDERLPHLSLIHI